MSEQDNNVIDAEFLDEQPSNVITFPGGATSHEKKRLFEAFKFKVPGSFLSELGTETIADMMRSIVDGLAGLSADLAHPFTYKFEFEEDCLRIVALDAETEAFLGSVRYAGGDEVEFCAGPWLVAKVKAGIQQFEAKFGKFMGGLDLLRDFFGSDDEPTEPETATESTWVREVIRVPGAGMLRTNFAEKYCRFLAAVDPTVTARVSDDEPRLYILGSDEEVVASILILDDEHAEFAGPPSFVEGAKRGADAGRMLFEDPDEDAAPTGGESGFGGAVPSPMVAAQCCHPPTIPSPVVEVYDHKVVIRFEPSSR